MKQKWLAGLWVKFAGLFREFGPNNRTEKI